MSEFPTVPQWAREKGVDRTYAYRLVRQGKLFAVLGNDGRLRMRPGQSLPSETLTLKDA